MPQRNDYQPLCSASSLGMRILRSTSTRTSIVFLNIYIIKKFLIVKLRVAKEKDC